MPAALEGLRIFKLAETLADEVWKGVIDWRLWAFRRAFATRLLDLSTN